MSETTIKQSTPSKHKFEVKVDGEYTQLSNTTDFNIDWSGTTETWSPMEAGGWEVSERVGVSFKITVVAKRSHGAKANDAIASLKDKILDEAKAEVKWTNPDGEVFEFVATINVTKDGGGETKTLDTLEFEVLPTGKPKITQSQVLNLDYEK